MAAFAAKTDTLKIGSGVIDIWTRNPARLASMFSTLDDLAPGATVATGSVRRRAQLARIRPDLQFVELRGNIDTRLSKVPDGGAIVMAVAALEILGMTDRIAERLQPWAPLVLRYLRAGKTLHLKHLSPECRTLLDKAGNLVEVNLLEDPTYRVADDRLA